MQNAHNVEILDSSSSGPTMAKNKKEKTKDIGSKEWFDEAITLAWKCYDEAQTIPTEEDIANYVYDLFSNETNTSYPYEYFDKLYGDYKLKNKTRKPKRWTKQMLIDNLDEVLGWFDEAVDDKAPHIRGFVNGLEQTIDYIRKSKLKK